MALLLAIVASADASAATIYQVSDYTTLAPKLQTNVKKAFSTFGYKVVVWDGAPFSGYCDNGNRVIILKREEVGTTTVYHEFGHFVGFAGGAYKGAEPGTEMQSVYLKEKDLFTGVSKAYATKDASEYFAESYAQYVLAPTALNSQRPLTYAFIKKIIGNVISSTNYTVSYSNNILPGTATAKVTFKGAYSGTMSKTYKISLANTTSFSVSALSKGVKFTWTKQTYAPSYQIQVATDSAFTANVSSVKVGSTTTSKNITGLLGAKTYYCRIRTYKKIDDKTYYSSWSSAKTIKTLK